MIFQFWVDEFEQPRNRRSHSVLEAQASEVHFVVDQTLEERQVQVVPLGKLVHSGVGSKLQGNKGFKLLAQNCLIFISLILHSLVLNGRHAELVDMANFSC